MVHPPPPWVTEMLHIWFDQLEEEDWFDAKGRTDALLRDRFADQLEQQSQRPSHDFLINSRTAQAAILLFDQVPRNIYRDTIRAYAFDPLALLISKEALDRGWDRELPDREKQFLVMPFMHSEDIADQEVSLSYFSEHLPDNLPFASSHHQMIAKFGRFPHRNAILKRQTTAAEQQAIDSGFSW